MASSPTDWIERLDVGVGLESFPEGFEHGRATRLAAAFDRMVMAGAAVPYALQLHRTIGTEDFERYVEDHGFYAQARFQDDPRSYFVEPPERVDVRELPNEGGLGQVRGIHCRHLVFTSPFEAVNPAMREDHASLRPNEKVEARGYFHDDRPRPTVLVLHGYFASAFAINERFFLVRRMLEAGLDVVLVQLPFHGLRKPHGTILDGQAVMTPRYHRVMEAFAQGMLDLRILVRHLRATRGVPIGVTGYSWGGGHAAMLAALEPSLDFAIPVGQVASMVDVTLTWPTRHYLRARFRDPRPMVRRMRRIIAATSPLSHRPAIPPERILFAVGRGDRIAPPGHTYAVHAAWKGTRLHVGRGGHVAYWDRGAVLAAELDFLRSIGVL